MSFAARVSKWMPLGIAAAVPTKSAMMALCLPRLLLVEGNPVGLVNLELAPLLVGGVASTRLLYALDELLAEPSPSPEEIHEAATLIRQHLASMAAASDLAHTEHEATHQHGREAVN